MATDYRKMTKAELLAALRRLNGDRPKDEVVDLSTVVEELHIHQTELEMQNRELREAYAALENALDRYQSLFDFAPVAYFTFDAAGQVIEMNLAAQEALGVDRKDLVGKKFNSFVAPGRVREFLSHLRQVFLSTDQLITELPLTVDQQEVTMQVFSSIMETPNDHRKVCRSAMIDVTERRKIERELQESEERYRRLFYPISDAVLLVDQATETIIDHNAAAVKLFGYPARQLVNMKLSNLFAEQEKIRTVLLNPTRATMVITQIKEDGTMFPGEISAYRFTHRGLVVAGITIRDITGQRRKEESHRQAEEQFHVAVYNVPGFLAVYDHERRYVFVNATAEAWLQHTLDDLRDKRDEEIASEGNRKKYHSLLAETFRTKSFQADTCNFQTEGGAIEAYMKCTPILKDAGEISQVVVTGGGEGRGRINKGQKEVGK